MLGAHAVETFGEVTKRSRSPLAHIVDNGAHGIERRLDVKLGARQVLGDGTGNAGTQVDTVEHVPILCPPRPRLATRPPDGRATMAAETLPCQDGGDTFSTAPPNLRSRRA